MSPFMYFDYTSLKDCLISQHWEMTVTKCLFSLFNKKTMMRHFYLFHSIPSEVTWNKKLKRDSTFVGRLTALIELSVETAYAGVAEHVPAGKHNEENSDPSKRLSKFLTHVFLLAYIH